MKLLSFKFNLMRAGIIMLVHLFLLAPGLINAQLRIMEVCASNSTIIADPDFGDYSDWIELYNGTSINIDLSGYALSDDTTDLLKWQFPEGANIAPGAFLLVFADGKNQSLHTSFNLDKQGEYLLLSDAGGVLVDSISYPFLLNDISYGRIAGSPETFSAFRLPTPGTANPNSAPEMIAPFPEFSTKGGFYDQHFKVGFAAPPNDAAIYYTTDGSYPDESALLYTDSIAISSTTVVRAIIIGADLIPGIAKTETYFVNEPQNLPVFSMVTDSVHLFSDETGIMVQGTNGTPGYCTDIPHNLNQDWERPVNIEFFEMGSEQVINQLCGTKIFGGCSRIRYPQKSLGFYARSEYEYSSFSYQLFPDKPSDEYETFILRACGDDQPHTFFRDPLTQMLVKDVIDVDMQDYRPVVLYINGQYWGIINLREKINEHYVQDNYGIHPDSVDILKRVGEDDWNVISGDNTEYKAMMDFVRNNDLSEPGNYSYIESLVDIDEYINYQVVQVYLGARDWPGNNIKYWRSSVEPYTKWRWILYDLDHHFKEYFSDIMEEATEVDCGCGWPNPPRSTLLFRKLLENEVFRNEFIARFNLYATTVFSRERMHAMVDQLRDALLPEIPRHIVRWGGQKNTHLDEDWMSPVFNSLEEWDTKIQVMHDFIDRRHEMALQQMQQYFGIEHPGTKSLKVALRGSSAASVTINGAMIQDTLFEAHYSHGTNLRFGSQPGEGYFLDHVDQLIYDRKDTMLISRGDVWRYDDSGLWPDDRWNTNEYDDTGWNTGASEFGYGDGDESTVVSFGSDPNNKHITTRFRKTFTLEDPEAFNNFEIQLKRDDGISVFLNGNEIIKNNQQRWYVGNDTPAEVAVTGEEENRFLVFNVNPAFLLSGENLLAAEVHQASPSSSDLSFDLQLNGTMLVPGETIRFDTGVSDLEMIQDQALTYYFIADTNIVESVFINEIMSDNSAGFQDESGQYEDWIEFYNAGPDDVDLAGLYLTDTLPAVKTWKFPVDRPELTTIPVGGHLLVVADNEQGSELLHTSFRLNNDGEEVLLLQRSGEDTLVIDRVTFGSQFEDIAWGRYPDGSPEFRWLGLSTPWQANAVRTLGPEYTETLFINEIMTANIDRYSDEAGDYDDWIEIYNAGDQQVDLAGLYLADSLPAEKPWRFPQGVPEVTTILPDSFLVVFADEEPFEGPLHATFRLNDTKEEVLLLHIVATDTILLDSVSYGEQYNNVSWGRYPDGGDEFAFMPVNTPWLSNYLAPVDTTGVEQNRTSEGLAIFPNPSHGAFVVRPGVDLQQHAIVSVYTVTGTKVYTGTYEETGQMHVEIPGGPAGIFIVEVMSGETRYMGRVVIR